jgi:hypothetical protein
MGYGSPSSSWTVTSEAAADECAMGLMKAYPAVRAFVLANKRQRAVLSASSS